MERGMKEYINVLKNCLLFSDINSDDIPAMLTCLSASVVKIPKDAFVFHEGDEANCVGIVLTGNVQIVKDDFFGNRSIVDSVEPGEIFGETFACAEVNEMPISVIASEDSEIMLVDCRRIIVTCGNSCEFHNKMINNLLKVMARKNLNLNHKIEIISKRTTRDKLMTYLMGQAKKNNSHDFVIPFDRQELADYLGVERSALSAEMSRMRKDGIIEYSKNKFKLYSES